MSAEQGYQEGYEAGYATGWTDAAKGPQGCCSGCSGTGYSGQPETNGLCWDCRGTGCAHPDPCPRGNNVLTIAPRN